MPLLSVVVEGNNASPVDDYFKVPLDHHVSWADVSIVGGAVWGYQNTQVPPELSIFPSIRFDDAHYSNYITDENDARANSQAVISAHKTGRFITLPYHHHHVEIGATSPTPFYGELLHKQNLGLMHLGHELGITFRRPDYAVVTQTFFYLIYIEYTERRV